MNTLKVCLLTVMLCLSIGTASENVFSRDNDLRLETFLSIFTALGMNSSNSRPLHNWFEDGSTNYCSFTGVGCDDHGNVITLDLNQTFLSGSLPVEISQFSYLRRLRLWQNDIGGTIPDALMGLNDLRQLNLGLNRISGKIPEKIGSLPLLRRLMLQGNELEGRLPKTLCNLRKLRDLDLSINVMLNGTVPSCMGTLTNIRILRLKDLGLSGRLPEGLCNLTSMNGLTPNPFGCFAIACPAGTFQPVNGRQQSDGTACTECPSPSNVIGSTTCRLVESEDVSISTERRSPSATPGLEHASRFPSLQPSTSTGAQYAPMPSSSHAPVLLSAQPYSVASQEEVVNDVSLLNEAASIAIFVVGVTAFCAAFAVALRVAHRAYFSDTGGLPHNEVGDHRLGIIPSVSNDVRVELLERNQTLDGGQAGQEQPPSREHIASWRGSRDVDSYATGQPNQSPHNMLARSINSESLDSKTNGLSLSAFAHTLVSWQTSFAKMVGFSVDDSVGATTVTRDSIETHMLGSIELKRTTENLFEHEVSEGLEIVQ